MDRAPLQDDVECEFGYERRNGTCVAMQGIAAAQCPALASGAYKISSSSLRQVQGDTCSILSRVRMLPLVCYCLQPCLPAAPCYQVLRLT